MALTSQQQALQNKIDVLDSSASTSTLLGLLVQSLDEGKIVWSYDSSGQIPVDSDYHGMIHFTHDSDKIRFVGTSSRVHLLDSQDTAPTAVASHIQGSTFGYSLGGIGGPTASNVIQKFSFTADANATDVADLTVSVRQHTGTYSSTDAFTHGGYTSAEIASVDKFNFASGGNATDFGDFPAVGRYGAGNSGPTHGYQAGGLPSPNAFGSGGNNKIVKYPFAAGSITTSAVGNLSGSAQYLNANASEENGYFMAISGASDVIEKFPFASDGNTTDVGDLLDATSDGRTHNGLLSDVSGGYGYTNHQPPSTYHIVRYPFSTDGDATDYCDFTFNNKWLVATAPSTTHGYYAGGLSTPGNSYQNDIAKFSYSSTSNTTDVADLLSTLGYNLGAAN